MRAIFIGVLSSVFFAITFILNRSIEVSGGSWLWSSSLRFLFMLPFLFIIVAIRGNLIELLKEMYKQPFPWFIWSFVGFGLFYAPLTYAAASGPGWLIAGTWQFTIIAGVLLTPLFHDREGKRRAIPIRSSLFSVIILIGILIIQLENADGNMTFKLFLTGMLPVILAAFAYPLGNRKMMGLYTGQLDTFQRVLGMTIASLPLWIVLATVGQITVGPPSHAQLVQTLIIALSSGVIATLLFFFATEMVKDDSSKLAAVEASQSVQIVFAIIGEILFLSIALPSIVSLIGILCVVLGMTLHSLFGKKMNRVKVKDVISKESFELKR